MASSRFSLTPLRFILLLTLTLVFSGSCRQPKTFPEFNSSAWKEDRLGCTGTRQQLRPEFDQIRNELKGLSQREVIDVLGKPDAQLLYQRNQKYYLYFLESGPQCQGQMDDSQAASVAVRFSALEQVTEITFQTGPRL
jgi:hypothetical protein